MKTIAVEHAVGTVLCHDITRIVPGGEKGPAFRRGHVVREEDIPVLLDIGKANLYVFDPADGFVHEDTAAVRLARAAAGRLRRPRPQSPRRHSQKLSNEGFTAILR